MKKIAQQIDELNQKLSTARNKLLSEIIEDDEKLEEELNQSEEKLKISNIKEIIHSAIEAVTNLARFYTDSGVKAKREIIGSIFPEKLEFDGKHY